MCGWIEVEFPRFAELLDSITCHIAVRSVRRGWMDLIRGPQVDDESAVCRHWWLTSKLARPCLVPSA